ncbi:relaxase domain-containing protein [Rhodopseudomonas palustris]|uniref:MobF family relaxase n=1 Tax=Rhodopseudomonas palustris TaxID=1076 RepID=UPI0020CE54E4|nr:MobF family relaxase [Rhodopseudomonas palustris]MBR2120137.1 relaxase domain-containing protein [Afipia sp.]MCP9628032.1 relaxase domain-containing protein [Rhodopseudomonas palustris]
MVASIGKGTVAQYYLRRTEYYLNGKEPAGVWLSNSAALGIKVGQIVDADLFEKLHAGVGPDGRLLITNDGGKERMPGFDLTLSAPKSVSIAFALADPDMRAAIERVQLDACKAVIAMLNREAAFTRRGRNGVVIEKTSLIVAAFQHGEARPAPHIDGRVTADMDLHTHLCLVNLGEKPVREGERGPTFGALDARPLFNAKMLAGSVYHLALSSGLQNLGFQVEVTGRNGIFELVTPTGPLISDDTKRYFSARRSKLEERLAEYDLVTGEAQQLASAVVKATRLSKSSDDRDRFEIWREQAMEQGVDVEHFIDRARTVQALSDRNREILIAQRLADIPSGLTEQESVFERRHLMAAVASGLVGTGAGAERVDIEVERLINSGRIVQLGQDLHGHGLYSTPEMIAIEKSLLKTAQSLAQRHWAAIDEQMINDECRRRGLSDEQRQAALAATDQRALAIVEGAAGSGKTTTLKVVVDAYLAAGKTVRGGAIAHRTAAMLRSELGIDATAIERLLAQIKSGQHILDRNTVLLIDECGQVGSKTMNELVTAVARAGAKLVLVGDRDQLQPISAGPALKILSAVVQPTRVDKIVRQREAWAQDAARAFAKGNAAAGLEAYAARGLLQGCAGAQATIRSAVDRYMDAQARLPGQKHLLIAKSNKTVRALNAEIRSRLRDAGRLTGPDHVIVAGDASGCSFRLHLAVGDKIRFGIRQDKIGTGVINGTVGRVEKIEDLDGEHLLVQATVDGKAVEFSTEALKDGSGRVRLSHDLAVTAYSAQGLTAETATVVLGSEYDRHESYVAVSRARGETQIFYDKSLLSAQAKGEQELRAQQNELADAAEMTYLAAKLSRANLKTSTLALTGEAEIIREQRHRGRDRNELSI